MNALAIVLLILVGGSALSYMEDSDYRWRMTAAARELAREQRVVKREAARVGLEARREAMHLRLALAREQRNLRREQERVRRDISREVRDELRRSWSRFD